MVILGTMWSLMVDAFSFCVLAKMGSRAANFLVLSTLNRKFRGCRSSAYR